MSCNEGHCSGAAAGQKRPGALELGPRKKPYVTSPLKYPHLIRTAAAVRIRLYTTADILGGQSMPYARSVLF